MVSMCVHHPTIVIEAQVGSNQCFWHLRTYFNVWVVHFTQDMNLQTGEQQAMPLEFWGSVVTKLELTEEQV